MAQASAGVPKPVITYFGEGHLLSSVVLKKLQTRLKSLQVSSLSKDDHSQAFNDVCDGVEFVELQKLPDSGGQYPRPLYHRPALHTFWTECWQQDSYLTITRRHIQQWLHQVEKGGGGGGGTECVIVYCITPEVRAKRQRTLTKFPVVSHVMEDMRNDFKGRELLLLRLASSEDSRVLDSLQTFCTRITSLCRAKFLKDIEVEANFVSKQRQMACKAKDLYGVFLQKLNLAVSYEMVLQNEEALRLYQEAAADLEAGVTRYCGSEAPPPWLTRVRDAPCGSWDYPKLAWHHLNWRYLPEIQAARSPLLHIHTFLLPRISHLHFSLERAGTVSNLVISTLHTVARQIRILKLPLPEGVFDCWAYMACNEAVLAIMSRVNPDSLVDSTTSLLLVRAELWHYALEKLHIIGGLCGLMPSSNALNRDKILIDKLSNGISLVPFEVSSKEIVEDQGRKLRDILISKDTFKQSYLMLGEMVIGAFKHAGRRRMAFRVGTKLARFHRDLGMMPEAEELLSDICRFYSEDQWLELSAPSYALLADCQKKLEMEDHTLVLLASLPAFPSAAHDPVYWMDQLMSVADKSPYEKILAWSPLLELVSVRMGGGGGEEGKRGGSVIKVMEDISLEVVLKSHAPEPMKNVIVVLTLITKSEVSSEQPPSPLDPAPSQSPTQSLSPLEELDLDMESTHRPCSRPIGQVTKARTSSTTHLTSSSIMEMEERGQKKLKLPLNTTLPSLPPGQSMVTITGKIRQVGEYFPEKISVKCGSLDFVISAPSPHGWWGQPLVASKKTEDISVTLLSELGIFLGGYPHECTLTFETGADSLISRDSSVSLVMSSDVIISCPGGTVSDDVSKGDKTVVVSLPVVQPSSVHSVPLHLTFPSHTSSDMDTVSTDNPRHYQLMVHLARQGESLKARVCVPVSQPLSFSHYEHSAGEITYLQLSLENTSPVPLLLRNPTLTADITTTQLHTNFPQGLAPGENFSCIWQTQPGSRAVGDNKKATFGLQYKPLIVDQESSYVDSTHTFWISNMQTVFHLQNFVHGRKKETAAEAGKVAVLTYVVKTVGLPTSQLPKQLHYHVLDPTGQWKIQDKPNGVLNTPHTNTSGKQICIQAVPSVSGALVPPRLTLSVPCVNVEVGNKGSKMVALTPAQVHELSLGETVTVG